MVLLALRKIRGSDYFFDLRLQGFVEGLLHGSVVAYGLVLHVDRGLYLRQRPAAEEEVRLDGQTGLVMRHDGVAVDHRLAHITFVRIRHDLFPRRRHLLRVRRVVIAAGLIVHHAQGLHAFFADYIQPVDGAAGQDLSDALYRDGEGSFLLQEVDLQPFLRVLAVASQDIGYIPLNDHILPHVVVGDIMVVLVGVIFRVELIHRLVRRHQRLVQLRLIRPDGFNRFGRDGHRSLVIAT